MTKTRNSTAAIAARAAAAVTGLRWCAHHNGEAPSDQGSMVQLGSKVVRFMCFRCQQKRAEIRQVNKKGK